MAMSATAEKAAQETSRQTSASAPRSAEEIKDQECEQNQKRKRHFPGNTCLMLNLPVDWNVNGAIQLNAPLFGNGAGQSERTLIETGAEIVLPERRDDKLVENLPRAGVGDNRFKAVTNLDFYSAFLHRKQQQDAVVAFL
jgi:hypothetical protein